MTLINCGKLDCKWNNEQEDMNYCGKKEINILRESWRWERDDPICESFKENTEVKNNDKYKGQKGSR